MNIPDEIPAAFDTVFLLSLIEGFTVANLRRLQKLISSDRAAFDRDSLYSRAVASLSCAKAKRDADAVRKICERSGVAIVSFMCEEYPEALKEIHDAPLVLYRVGSPWPGGAGVAMVGSRAPTVPAMRFAHLLAADLAAAGYVVVSGMARGIDAAAHRGALSAGGKTVAVLGCGPDVAYPPENAKLKNEIAEKGALYSEYPPGSPPIARRFPVRNRIVSGLCRATVIVEAPKRSGALITARLALEQGREVMAAPGNPWFAHTAGSNRLLQEGAAPVCCAADVIDALGGIMPTGSLSSRVLSLLDRERRVEEIACALQAGTPELLAVLMELELADLVVKDAGGYYKKKVLKP